METTSLDNFLKSIGFQNLIFDDFWTLGNATSLSEEMIFRSKIHDIDGKNIIRQFSKINWISKSKF